MDIVRDPSLVFYTQLWKHDGTPFPSDDAYGITMTPSGAVWNKLGRYFNGINDYISVGSTVNASIPLTVFSWVHHRGTGVYMISSFNAGSNNQHLINNGVVQFGDVGNNQYIESTAAVVSPNHWWNVVIVCPHVSPQTWRMYINNKEITSLTKNLTTSTLAWSSGRIGYRVDNNFPFLGWIGEYGILRKALTPIEVGNLHLSTKGRYA